MEKQYGLALAIDGRRKVFKTDRATYESLPPLDKLVADVCIRNGTLVIAEGVVSDGR
jgi:hypothetical protein